MIEPPQSIFGTGRTSPHAPSHSQPQWLCH